MMPQSSGTVKTRAIFDGLASYEFGEFLSSPGDPLSDELFDGAVGYDPMNEGSALDAEQDMAKHVDRLPRCAVRSGHRQQFEVPF